MTNFSRRKLIPYHLIHDKMLPEALLVQKVYKVRKYKDLKELIEVMNF